MSDYSTNQINIAAYLGALGYQLLDTRKNGRMMEFVFAPEAEEAADEFKLRPTDEIRLVQRAFDERERMFRLLKDEMRKTDYAPYQR